MSAGRALVAALAILGLFGVAARRADAEIQLAAVRPDSEDARRTQLLGPSGQLWEPDGIGTWTRRALGGVAADVSGAIQTADLLIVVGRATPLYRRDGEVWRTLRLGERGRTLAGSGPRGAIAIGRQVFIHANAGWKRVATADRAFAAVWAASEKALWIGGPSGVARLIGRGFRPHTPTPVIGFGDGPVPWAITADGALLDVTSKRIHRPTTASAPLFIEKVVVSPERTVWALGRSPTGIALVRRRGDAWPTVPAPPIAADDAVIGLAVDKTGTLLIAGRSGAVYLGAGDGAWRRATLVDAPPTLHPGPPPARTP